MTFICFDCGRVFDESEFSHWIETHGERMEGCPNCQSTSYEETVCCAVCGEIHGESETIDGVCEKCIDERRKDFDFCYKASIDQKTEININSLIASLFDVSEIEQILVEYIKRRWKDVDCSAFIDDDVYFFAEVLKKEGGEFGENKKNKQG